MDVDAGSGKERVAGKLRPGNEVRRTFSVWGAMMRFLSLLDDRDDVVSF